MSQVIHLPPVVFEVVPAEHWGLFDVETGRQVYPGDKLNTSDGELVTLIDGTPPHKPSSSGRVHCKYEDTDLDCYWFPGVVNLTWRRIDNDLHDRARRPAPAPRER